MIPGGHEQTMVVWRGGNPWGWCSGCGKPVRLNKPLVGSLHVCKTACQRAGRHLEPKTKVVGWIFRRTVNYCGVCHYEEEVSS